MGAIVLSMANARHAHEHHCFERRPLPDHMSLVTGVIDTTAGIGDVAPSLVWAKLRSLSEGAAIVSEALF